MKIHCEWLRQSLISLLFFSASACGRIGYELLEVNSEGSDADTRSSVDGDSHSDADTQSDTGDTGLDTSSADTSADTGTQSDTYWDTSTDIQCSGQPDFTFCAVVTAPDRAYDICVAGLCVSPGCGDASCNVPGPHFPIADTNHRACYDASGPMTCPSPGQAFFGQDAQYGWDVTHGENERYTRTATTANQPLVEDNVTTLVWQGCEAGLSGASCTTGSPSTYTWNEALVYCDSLDWGGHSDWRLPDPYELSSVLDSSRMDPAIDLVAFPASSSERTWLSSSNADKSADAWFIDFQTGYQYHVGKSASYRVRCVRSGLFEARRFDPAVISGERVVRDRLTGLEWQGCAAGLSGADCSNGSVEKFNWQQALAYCEGLSYAENADWRVPNRAELQSIVDLRRINPSIDAAAFPFTVGIYFWSSSSFADGLNFAWYVDFDNGDVTVDSKNTSDRVRCVRARP